MLSTISQNIMSKKVYFFPKILLLGRTCNLCVVKNFNLFFFFNVRSIRQILGCILNFVEKHFFVI